MKRNVDLGLLLTRIIIGAPMLLYGINKLQNGIDFIRDMLINAGLPGFVSFGVYLGEIVAPLMLIIGYKTRLAGIVFAMNCLAAILLAQPTAVFTLNDYGGWAIELLAIYGVLGLALFFTGGGRFALSATRSWD